VTTRGKNAKLASRKCKKRSLDKNPCILERDYGACVHDSVLLFPAVKTAKANTKHYFTHFTFGLNWPTPLKVLLLVVLTAILVYWMR
jgi:hypothetical protein